MNAYIKAIHAMNAHIDNALAGARDIDAIRKELTAKTHEELVELLIVSMKAEKVTVDSIARAILEDEECAILTYSEIATGICDKKPGNTSDKSIASYASKRKADWTIVARSTATVRNTAMRELAGLTVTAK
jgi:hypothetical protein